MDASFTIDTSDDGDTPQAPDDDTLRAEAIETLKASINFDPNSRPSRRRAFSTFLRTLLQKGN